jgi:hypothetical protein
MAPRAQLQGQPWHGQDSPSTVGMVWVQLSGNRIGGLCQSLQFQ